MSGIVRALYFSPTHSSGKIALALAADLAGALGKASDAWDLTLPPAREKDYVCAPEDVLVFAFPVYAGRLPQLLQAPLARLTGNGAATAAVAVYGNRDYDDALLEAVDLLTRQNCTVTAAGAFIAEHSLAPLVGAGRPDARDMRALADFAKRVAAKIAAGKPAVQVKGKRPYKERGPAADIRPKTRQTCTRCMICVQGCPVGVISGDDPGVAAAGCIRCCACVKFCPEKAKYFDDETMARIRGMLESKCTARREPELFV